MLNPMRPWRYLINLLRSVFAVGILAGAILFSAAYPFSDATPEHLALAALLIGTVAALTAILKKVRLTIWMSLTFIAYIAGMVYALDLLYTPDVTDGYGAAVMTVTVFVIHGFVVGAFIELVTWIHRVTGRLIEKIKERTALKLEEE